VTVADPQSDVGDDRSAAIDDEEVLRVEDLSVAFYGESGPVTVVDHVSFRVRKGETLGLVGESGSGKTVTTQAMMGLIQSHAGTVGGEVHLAGEELLALRPEALRIMRGQKVGMIFQEPIRSLDPAFTVGDQIAEVARVHLGCSRREAWARAVDMLEVVEISRAAERARDYPHMLSGGMCQRVMIAIALVCRPQLLIADEPTTALDVTVQAQILDLLRNLQAEMGVAIVFVTHDLGVVAEMCDRVAVMYAGQIVEEQAVEGLFLHPRHPYTEGLLAAIPDVHISDRRMSSIPGTVPRPGAWPTGCRFAQRCSHVEAICTTGDIALVPNGEGAVRCVRQPGLTLEGLS
jgi:oligopeptide/dipeptide ABC transporter ATP-binding protein